MTAQWEPTFIKFMCVLTENETQAGSGDKKVHICTVGNSTNTTGGGIFGTCPNTCSNMSTKGSPFFVRVTVNKFQIVLVVNANQELGFFTFLNIQKESF